MFKTVAFLKLFLLPCILPVVIWCLSHTWMQSSFSSFSSSGSSKSSHSLSLSCVSLAGRDDDEGPQTRGCGVALAAETVLELPPRGSEVTDIELAVRYSSSIGVRERVSGIHFVFNRSSWFLLNTWLENKKIAVLGFSSICFIRWPLKSLLFMHYLIFIWTELLVMVLNCCLNPWMVV